MPRATVPPSFGGLIWLTVSPPRVDLAIAAGFLEGFGRRFLDPKGC